MELSDFHNGLYIPPYFGGQIPATALLRADNIEYSMTGVVHGRRGRSVYGSVPTGTVTSLYRHYPRTGSPAFLAYTDTGSSAEIRHDTASSGTFGPITGGTGFATGKRPTWTNWGSKDRSFFANGAGLWSYNGVITPVVQVGPQMTGPYVVVHQSRLFGTKLDEINWSVYATDINDETTVPAENQLNVSDPQGGSITGLFSLPDRLVIFKSSALFSMLGDIRYNAILTKYSETGAIAPYSIAQAPYGIFFVGRQGIYLTDGVQTTPLNLTGPIEPLFTSPTTNTSHANAIGFYYPRKDQYIVKLSPSDAHCYVLSRVTAPGEKNPTWAWAINTSLPLQAGAVWDAESDNGSAFTAGNVGSSVYRIDDGATDAGAAYTSVIQTASLRLDEQQAVGRISYVYLNYQGTQPCSVGLRYNNAAANDLNLTLGASQALGLQRPRLMVVDQSKFGHFVSAVVTLPNDGPSAELYSLRLDARLRSSRIWR